MSDSHKHDHKHTHGVSNRARLGIVLSLTITYLIAEAVGGYLTNSLALLSDAGHMLTDVAALMLAMLALWFASRPATTTKTYGYYRTEILAALANGVALVVISILIFIEAYERLRRPEPVEGFEVMLIAAGGLVVNLVSAWLLHSAREENLNIRGAFLHIMGDALGSIGAIVSGLLVWQWGWTMADAAVSVIVCLLIIYSSWKLIRESVNILLEGTPAHINVESVIEVMESVEGVIDVHDLHVWTISSGKDALSAHVTMEVNASYKRALRALQDMLRSEFNIGHVTLQLELADEERSEGIKLYKILPKGEDNISDAANHSHS